MSIYNYQREFEALAEEFYELIPAEERRVARVFYNKSGPEWLFLPENEQAQRKRVAELCNMPPKRLAQAFQKMDFEDRIMYWLRLRHVALVAAKTAELYDAISDLPGMAYRKGLSSIAGSVLHSMLSPATFELLESEDEGPATTELRQQYANGEVLGADEWAVIDARAGQQDDALDCPPEE